MKVTSEHQFLTSLLFYLSFYSLDDANPEMELKVTLEHGLDEDDIGRQTQMSDKDIASLNKAYSCNRMVSTYGGGSFQVISSSSFKEVSIIDIYPRSPARVDHQHRQNLH
jgi:hypothetical protein